MTTSESYYLTPQERSSLENKAIKNSDASAAYDLAFYYEASAFDEVQAYKWFTIAKKLGDKRAASWINALEERQKGSGENKSLGETGGQKLGVRQEWR